MKDNEFMRSISFEENAFEGEPVAEERFFDFDGNEVTENVAE